MKVTIETSEDKRKFPLLAKVVKNGTYKGVIALFITENKATYLNGPFAGEFSSNFILANDWEILPTGTKVILTQE